MVHKSYIINRICKATCDWVAPPCRNLAFNRGFGEKRFCITRLASKKGEIQPAESEICSIKIAYFLLTLRFRGLDYCFCVSQRDICVNLCVFILLQPTGRYFFLYLPKTHIAFWKSRVSPKWSAFLENQGIWQAWRVATDSSSTFGQCNFTVGRWGGKRNRNSGWPILAVFWWLFTLRALRVIKHG